MKRCGNSWKYRGTRAPNCNGGNPCDSCVAKWKANGSPEAKATAEPTLEASLNRTAENQALSRARAENALLTAEVGRLSELLNLTRHLKGLTPYDIAPAPKPVKGEAVPVILASDWHVEEHVDPRKVHGTNAYTLEIARNRAELFAQNSTRLIHLAARDSTIRRVMIGLIGDLFSGHIHPELMEVNELGPQPAARYAMDLMTGVINHWLANTTMEFDLYCVGGNHGRMTEKTRIATITENSLEVFAYYYLAAHYKKENRVRFHIADGDMIYGEAFPGYKIRFIHGDQISFAGGVGGVSIPLNKWISRQDNAIRASLTCLGHFHQLNGGPGDRFLINGSLIGASPYSQRFGFSPEAPAQAFTLIHSRRGGVRSLVAPIWVNETPLT